MEYLISISPRLQGGFAWAVSKGGKLEYCGTARTRQNAEKTAKRYVNYAKKLDAKFFAKYGI